MLAKLFSRCDPDKFEEELSTFLNEFEERYPDGEIVDIKYASTAGKSDDNIAFLSYSALVLYKEVV